MIFMVTQQEGIAITVILFFTNTHLAMFLSVFINC